LRKGKAEDTSDSDGDSAADRQPTSAIKKITIEMLFSDVTPTQKTAPRNGSTAPIRPRLKATPLPPRRRRRKKSEAH
jgi:hypothetical protein